MATSLDHDILDEGHNDPAPSPILDEAGRAILSSFPVPDEITDLSVKRPRHSTESLDSGSDEIVLDDDLGDVTGYYSANDTIELSGTSDDDGTYTVSSVTTADPDSDGNTETVITVNESIETTEDIASGEVRVSTVVELNFSDISNASNYLVLRASGYRGTMTEIANISQTTKDGNEPAYSYQDTGLTASSSYRYQVRPVNQNNADNMPARRSDPAYSPGTDKTLK